MPDDDTPLRVLIVEDSPDDAALIAHELEKAGYRPVWERVETAEAMRAALRDRAWDIIISDYVVPGFGGMQALQLTKDSGLDIPFVAISGKVDEETLIEVVKAGACDFLVKGHIGRLDSVVRRELALAETRRNIHQAEIHWRTAFDAVRDAIFVHDAEFRILRANLAYAALAGMPVQDIIGKPYWEIFPRTGKPLPGSKAAIASGKWVEEELRLPDGATYQSRAFPIVSGAGKYLYSLNILVDITERNRVRDAVEASERRFRALSEHGSDLVVVVDANGKVTYISPSIKRLGGYDPEEVLGKSYLELAHTDDHPASLAGFAQLLREPALRRTTEYRFRRKDGEWEILESIAWNALADPLIRGIVINARVVTERKKTLAALERSERHFRKLIEGGADAFFVINAAGKIVYRSPSGKQLTGWGDEEVMGKGIDTYIVPEDVPLAQAAIAETVRNPGKETRVEVRVVRKDGKVIQAEASGRNLLADPDVGGIVVTVRDFSERKRAEEALLASRDLLGSVVEHAPVRVFWKDLELRYLGCNSLFARDAGKSHPEELLGKDDFQMAWREQAELYRADDRRVIESDTPRLGIEEPQTTPDGRTIWLRTSKVPLHGADGKAIGVLGVYEDVTDRKRAEEELKRLNWAMHALSQSNSALVHAATEQELFSSCCEAITSTEAYPLAWIGLAGDDPARKITPAAAAGNAVRYLDGISVNWADTPEGRGPTGTAIRTGKTQIVDDFETSASFLPWRKNALAHGLASSITLPIMAGDAVIGALMVYSHVAHAFGKAETALFEELAGDISYGIAARRMRIAYDASVVERERSAAKLRKSLEDSIQAIAATVEARDPYTAGHEKRVAEIAAAIAREMGLPADAVEGIHFGSLIHDLGKIRVPAEILSKPSRLLPIEFELIKAHAQAGYDILKDIDFPWPAAQMVLQHHERMDGSGYPNGLKGEAIIVEARVLAVADTVEAMASHRPYRPGLGVEAALKEIEKSRGTLFDVAVVDACLRLFREKGYRLPA